MNTKKIMIIIKINMMTIKTVQIKDTITHTNKKKIKKNIKKKKERSKNISMGIHIKRKKKNLMDIQIRMDTLMEGIMKIFMEFFYICLRIFSEV